MAVITRLGFVLDYGTGLYHCILRPIAKAPDGSLPEYPTLGLGLLLLLVDVAHVYGSLYRTYLDPTGI